MRVFRQLEHLPTFKLPVVTIGSYDGVHAGHQQLIARINEIARELGGESIVITFHPHPRFVVNPTKAPKLLTTIDEKIELFKKYGIDNLAITPFNKDFASQSPQSYIEDFLVKKFQPRYIVIGYDHKFGKNRAGDIDFLKKYENKYGYKVLEISKHEVDDITVSSTKVRTALNKGDVKKAKQLLNHPFTLQGKVIHGQRIGSTIGFPTANIAVSSSYKLIPPEGIYAVEIIHQTSRYAGMLYIGRRPTLEGIDNQTIEVNIFDFDKNIYGDDMTIEFVERIRDDIKFNNLDELKIQLAKDKAATLNILKLH